MSASGHCAASADIKDSRTGRTAQDPHRTGSTAIPDTSAPRAASLSANHPKTIKKTDMFFTFLIVVILTAVALVVAAMTIANLIAPRSYNRQKGEPYECGIPTRGQSWVQFRAGYYLFAILFLMFDIETVFLFPWAVIVEEIGTYAIVSISFFIVILVLGLAYAWKKGALKWK